MAILYATEAALYLNNTPAQFANGNAHGGRVRVYRATIEYDGQANGDEIQLAKIPSGSTFLKAVIVASATAGGTATIAIGDASTEPSSDPDRYKSAATFTSADSPTTFGRSIAVEEGALAADRIVSAYVGAAALPNNANSMVIDLYFCNG